MFEIKNKMTSECSTLYVHHPPTPISNPETHLQMQPKGYTLEVDSFQGFNCIALCTDRLAEPWS